MKKTSLLVLTALSAAMAFAAPAMAQPYGGQGGGLDVDHRIQWVQDRIIRGRDDRSLDRGEFDRVQGELNNIRREEEHIRFDHGGHLDERARVDLAARLDHLNDQIHWIHEHNEQRPW